MGNSRRHGGCWRPTHGIDLQSSHKCAFAHISCCAPSHARIYEQATRAKPSQYLWGALDKMQNAGIQPNSLTYTLIIRYFAEAGNLELALRYMQITTNAGMSIDLRTMEAVISQAAARGFPRLAVELVMDFEKNTVRRIDPTVWLKCLASASDQRWVCKFPCSNVASQPDAFVGRWRPSVLADGSRGSQSESR